MEKTREDIIEELHTTFGLGVNQEPTVKVLQLRKKLIEEETRELSADIDKAISFIEKGETVPKEIYANMLKEMADIQIVLSGTSVALKPLRKFQDAFELVHASNMSKLGPDGKPIIREDGKIIKGPNYFEPDLSDLV